MANTKIPVELSSTPSISDSGDATAITIDSSENVGIGATSPQSRLEIAPPDNSTANKIIFSHFPARADANDVIAGGIESQFRTRDANVNTGAFIRILDKNTNSSFPTGVRGGEIVFGTIDGATGFSSNPAVERMRIDVSGNVGIGTSTPLTRLHLDTGTSGVPRIRFSHANTGNDSFEIGSGLDGITNGGWQIKDVDAVVNRFMIDSNGNIGMGNANVTPTVSASAYTGACLHIAQSTSSSAGAQIRLTTAAGGHTGSDGSFISHYSDLNTYYYNADSGGHLFYVGGNLKFQVTSLGGSSVSDEKYKENIQDISYGLDTVKSLQPRKFSWKDTKVEGIGFIAQEVKPLINEVVNEPHENGPHESSYTLNYDALTAVLTKAIQEQQTIIDDLKSRIEKLEG